MPAVIDLLGASGAPYRYRQITDRLHLPALGGGFVCVRRNGQGAELMACGVMNDLGQAWAHWEQAMIEHLADRLFIRLNASRAMRARELNDLVSLHQPPMVVRSDR